MKIKTITCHDVYNYGATLQAYALLKYLQKEGHDVEIIDYKPDYLSSNNSFYLWNINSKLKNINIIIKILYYCVMVPARYLTMFKGKYAYDLFKRKTLVLTKKRYKNNDDLKRNPPVADVFIAGSDQIWNTVFQNGKDPAFYLDFVPVNRYKISYAASFATDEIVPEYRTFVKNAIEKLNHISVREQQGINILKTLGIGNAVCVVDPVFLLSEQDWELVTNPIKFNNRKYILIYEIESNPLIEKIAKSLAKKNNWLIYAISCYHPTQYADKDYFNRCGPGTYLALIKNAEIILSNSFHATAFSIIFEKNFITFKLLKHSINSRMSGLLMDCGISGRLISTEDEHCNILEIPINYILVKQKLAQHINRSKLFLENALKGSIANG